MFKGEILELHEELSLSGTDNVFLLNNIYIFLIWFFMNRCNTCIKN